MSADPKILRTLDTDIEADQNSWASLPDGLFLGIKARRFSSSLVGNGTTATVVTTFDHGFSTGNSVIISGVSPSGFNGTHTITRTNDTTFTIPSTVNATATVQGLIELGPPEYQLALDDSGNQLLVQ
jgi:hypothetical protein